MNQPITKPKNSTGNDLETSEELSFTLFCTLYKERLSAAKLQNI